MSLGACTHQRLQPFPKNVREQYLVFLQGTDYGVKITAFVCLHTAGCWLKAPIKSKALFCMSDLHSEVNCHPKTRDAVGYTTQFWDLKLSCICYLGIKTTLIAWVNKGGILCNWWGLSPRTSRWSLVISEQLQPALLENMKLVEF